MHKYRTHNCSELRSSHENTTVKLSGWVHRKRDHGNLLFIDLRDNYGITQCVIENTNKNFKILEKIRPDSVIFIAGKVLKRTPETINNDLPTGKIEVEFKDLDENFSENLLYTVLNIIEQENKYLLITSFKPLNKFNFKLPDLVSRIRNCLIIGIKQPDDNLIFALLIKYLSDRQININKKLIEYIIKRVDRSYEKIFLFIHKIDKLSLKRGKPINLATIKEALEK